jgi:uroporphyrinogen decarboxylase
MHFAPYPRWEQALEKYRRLHAAGRYMLLNVYGPWEQMWRHRGMENLLVDLATDPDWVEDMARTYQDLVLAILDRCLALGIKPDGLLMVEDLGSNRATLMSPACWRRIFKPETARVGDFLARHGIDFWMHSCGAVQALVDDLVECGLGVLNPLQGAAGLDVVDMRQRYGRRLTFFGNIAAKRMLGPRAELEAEIRRKVPVAAQGGYIFHSDHSVPPQVDFDQYCWMLRLAREVFQESSRGSV